MTQELLSFTLSPLLHCEAKRPASLLVVVVDSRFHEAVAGLTFSEISRCVVSRASSLAQFLISPLQLAV